MMNEKITTKAIKAGDSLTSEQMKCITERFKPMVDEFQINRLMMEKLVYEMKSRYDDLDITEKLLMDTFTYYLKNKDNKNHNYVYFFRNIYTNLVKIGSTTDIVQRFKNIRSVCKNYLGMEDAINICGIIDTAFIEPLEFERFLHERYKQYRKYGEWFELPDIIWEEICNDFICNPKFVDTETSEKDKSNLNFTGKIYNIAYIGNPDDCEFTEFLYNCCKKERPIDERYLKLYVDKMLQLTCGFQFTKENLENYFENYFSENEPFYRYLFMSLSNFFIEPKYNIEYLSFDDMVNNCNELVKMCF